MELFTNVVLPILLVVAAGAVAHARFRLDIRTMSKLTIWLFVPAFLFEHVHASTLGWRDIGGIVAVILLTLVLVGLPLTIVLRRARMPGPTVGAMLLGGVLSNAGNVGIPVAQFFYATQGMPFDGMASPQDGVAVQALAFMVASLSIWLLGYGVLATARGDGLRGVLGFFRLPMIYVIVVAFVLRELRNDHDLVLPAAVLDPIRILAGALVPFMLLILGAQLVESRRWPRWRRISPVLAIKLVILPVATGLVAWTLGLWPWPGAQLVLAAAAPTAINIVLLSVEVDGDAATAADCVFWSTLFSCVTLTVTMTVLLQIG